MREEDGGIYISARTVKTFRLLLLLGAAAAIASVAPSLIRYAKIETM